MAEEKTCYNCGNKKCHIFYYSIKQDVAEHHETYEYTEFDCVNHDKWEELKVEEIRTDNTKTLKNALERIAELEKENAELKEKLGDVQMQKAGEKSDLVWKLKTANEQKAEQLTEAKEIISEYIRLANLEKEDTVAVWQLYHKAEQFLNSEVEK